MSVINLAQERKSVRLYPIIILGDYLRQHARYAIQDGRQVVRGQMV